MNEFNRVFQEIKAHVFERHIHLNNKCSCDFMGVGICFLNHSLNYEIICRCDRFSLQLDYRDFRDKNIDAFIETINSLDYVSLYNKENLYKKENKVINPIMGLEIF